MTKSKTRLFARTSLACLLFVPALLSAQQSTGSSRSAANSPDRPDGDRPMRLKDSGAALKATDLIGMKIENTERQNIGKVEDLAIDLQSGRVVQLIVSTGGLLSIGDRHVAVPPGSIHYGDKSKPLHFDITPERLKSAPAFEMSRWADFYQSDRVKDSNRYFGDEALKDAAAVRQDRNEGSASGSQMGYVQKGSKLVGMAVRNAQDEKIGSVDDLIIDLPAGRVVAVVVSSGGFLGMGDTLSVIPPGALRFSEDRDRLQLDTTKEALSNAPRFKKGEWPDFAQADYTAGVYRAYNQEPYAGGSHRKAADADYSRGTRDRDVDSTRGRDADNAARNTRDRDGRTLTPADQGGNVSDVTLTQQIRKAVTDTEGLSVNARNVKIITVNGRVTLRGPVRTADEKAKIAAIAARFAQAGNVDDQLEVAAR